MKAPRATSWLTGPRSELTPAQKAARAELDRLETLVNGVYTPELERAVVRAVAAVTVAGGVGRDVVTLVAEAFRRAADEAERQYDAAAYKAVRASIRSVRS